MLLVSCLTNLHRALGLKHSLGYLLKGFVIVYLNLWSFWVNFCIRCEVWLVGLGVLLFFYHSSIELHVAASVFSAAAAAKSLQSCPTLCDSIDGSPSGSAIPGILQARTLEWVAISFSNAWKWKGKVKSLSCVRLFETPWTAAYQAPPSMGFSLIIVSLHLPILHSLITIALW